MKPILQAVIGTAVLLAIIGCAQNPLEIQVSEQQTTTKAGLGKAVGVARALEVTMAVQNRATEKLMAIPGVVGTGTGLDAEGNPVIRVFTENPGVGGIPQRIEDQPVAVVVTGKFIAQALDVRYPRPVPIGVSTGHPAITAGTIGCRVRNSAGQVFALSNNHVYANENNASIGDNVLQPGTYDGGVDPADAIGTLHDFEPIDFSGAYNDMDAAIALTTSTDCGNATPVDIGYGVPATTVVDAAVGLEVMKVGRATGLTYGTVSEVNVIVQVCYAVDCLPPRYKKCFCVKSAVFRNQIAVVEGSFSGGGDSGSLIVTRNGKNPVALLFAGSDTRTLANPMGPVLARFGVTVDGEDPGPTPNQAPTAGFSYTVNDLTASFTDASTDADGDILSRLWNFGDGNTSTVQNPVHTYAAYGGYTVSLTVTDNEDASDAASEVVTLTDPNAPPATVHVGDIDGSSKTAGKSGKWQATVEVTVHDNDEATVAGATVSATWSGALTGSVSATTDYRGIAVFSTGNMTSGTQVVLTVDNVAASGAEYDETVNHDPDGESSGTTITVTK